MGKSRGKISDMLRSDDGLLSSSIIFFIGSILVSVLNYLYHLFMGRMLGPAAYGVLGSLFAIIYFATFTSQTFQRVLSKFCSDMKGKRQTDFLKYLILGSLKKVIWIGIIILIIYAFIVPYIGVYMRIHSFFGIFLAGVVAYTSILAAIILGSLNGLQKFAWQNALGVVQVFLKFAIAVVLVYIGFGVLGALGAILISSLIAIGIGLFPLLKDLRGVKKKRFDPKGIYKYMIPTFLANVFPVLFITIDMIIVKHYFTITDAGLYAASGMIAKIIWFGSGFVVYAAFPKISTLFSQKKNTQKILVRAIVYTAVMAALGCLAYYIMPTFIVKILYGADYMQIVDYIGLFGLAMGLFSVNQMLISFNLAIEKYGFIYILAIGLIIEVTGILLFHSTLLEIIKILFGVNLLVLLSMLIYNNRELGFGNAV